MLLRDEIRRWAIVFRAADEQIRRDHLISHCLRTVREVWAEALGETPPPP